MTRPKIADPDGVEDGLYPYGMLIKPEYQNQVISMLNEHAGALDLVGPSSALNAKTDFAAVGDGVADDTTALTNAITSAITNKKPLWLPNGTYLLNSTLTIPLTSWLHLFGTGATIKFTSTARNGLQVTPNSTNLRFQGITFVGDTTSDDLNTNFYPAIQLDAGVTDIVVEQCVFDHCTPLTCPDVITCSRLTMRKCYVHNQPNGVHPPSDSTLDDIDFICDSYVATRSEAVYIYASQQNITINNCRTKNITAQDFQIRGVDPHFQQKNNFRITNCHFENSHSYALWMGSDSHPAISGFLVDNCTFLNCQSSIMCQGAESGIISNCHTVIDFRFPGSFSASTAISVLTGVGLSGHYAVSRHVQVNNCEFIVKHPFWTAIGVKTLPANGDNLTIADITYTWKTTATSSFDIQIGADVYTSAQNLLATLRGLDGRATAPCNALRYTTDAWGDPFGNTYGTTVSVNGNTLSTQQVVWVASGNTFSVSQAVGTGCVFNAVVDLRQAVSTALAATGVIGLKVDGITIDDFATGITATQNVHPWFDNCVMETEDSHAPLFTCNGNTKPYYGPGCRQKFLHEMIPDREYQNQFADAFPVIECPWIVPQQLTNPELGLGRTGVKTVGDMQAYTYFWYGSEIASQVDATTLRFRWQDGDAITLYDGTTGYGPLTYKRTAPGANQFNTAAGLITLIQGLGAGAVFNAALETFVADLGGADPQMLIKIWLKSTGPGGGTAGNAGFLNFRRYKFPGDTTTYATVPQPLLTGIILRDSTAHGPDLQYTKFYGGAATRIKTFVFTPIANAQRGVWVQGIDSTAQALNPIVYQADIIPGVGFYITHGAAVGTEKFLWRVN